MRFNDDSASFNSLVCDLYDAAADDALWGDVIANMSALFGSTSALVQVHSPAGAGQLVAYGAARDYLSPDYQAYYWSRDVWVERAASAGLRTVVTSHDMIPDAEFERTEFYNDCCRKLDLFYVVGGVFPIGEGSFGAIGLHRPRSIGNYSDASADTLRKFLPHIEKVLRIRARLTADALTRQIGQNARDREAILVVDRNGFKLTATAAAERILEQANGLKCRNGQIVALRDADTRNLLDLIRGVARDSPKLLDVAGRAIALQRGPGRLPLIVLVAPARPANRVVLVNDPAAILYIRDPEVAELSATLLTELFGLTPAEVRVATALARGQSVEHIATSLSLNIATVRTHVQRLLQKTGTNRQTQLLPVLLQSMNLR